jgi:hypothetical protein
MSESVRTDFMVSNMPVVRVLPRPVKKKPTVEINIPSSRNP